MVPLLFALPFLGWATWHDFRTREIPDWISITLACIALISSVVGWLDMSLWLVLLGGVIAAVIGFALFCFAELGGGDVKLIAALGLLLGPVGTIIFLILMAIAGGGLAIVALLRKQRDYAYAPAITIGFIGTLLIIWALNSPALG